MFLCLRFQFHPRHFFRNGVQLCTATFWFIIFVIFFCVPYFETPIWSSVWSKIQPQLTSALVLEAYPGSARPGFVVEFPRHDWCLYKSELFHLFDFNHSNDSLSIFLSISIYLSVCLSVCLPACLPACLPGWLAVCLSVCLSVLSRLVSSRLI